MTTTTNQTVQDIIDRLAGIGTSLEKATTKELREINGADTLLDEVQNVAKSTQTTLTGQQSINEQDFSLFIDSATNLFMTLNAKPTNSLSLEQKTQKENIRSQIAELNKAVSEAVKAADPASIIVESVRDSSPVITKFRSVIHPRLKVINKFVSLAELRANLSQPGADFTRSLLNFKPDGNSQLQPIPKDVEVTELVQAWQVTHDKTIEEARRNIQTSPDNRKAIANIFQQRQILLKLKQDMTQCVKEE